MNTLDSITEKSYRVLDVIGQSKGLSQREVAEEAGISLGMANLIVKRLISTGYLKVAGLSRKKLEYILTPKGISERMTRSYQYLVRAYRAFRESQTRLDRLLMPLLQRGERRFAVVGDGEIAVLVEMTLHQRGGADIDVARWRVPAEDDTRVVLDCRFGQADGPVGISVLEAVLDSSHGDQERLAAFNLKKVVS